VVAVSQFARILLEPKPRNELLLIPHQASNAKQLLRSALDVGFFTMLSPFTSHIVGFLQREASLAERGIGNLISGLFGGLPGAGATMRTVVNVRAGGQTPLSGIIHGFLLLVIVLGAGKLTESIPQAILAGILIKVGIDIIDWSFLKRAHRISKKAAGIMYGVLFLTVFVDLITAVAVGVFVANLLTVQKLTDWQAGEIQATTIPNEDMRLSHEEKQLLLQAHGRILLFRLGGPLSFGAAKSISRRMTIVEKFDVLILDFSDVPILGVTASLAIETMIKDAIEQRREVFVVGASGDVQKRLRCLEIFENLPPRNRVTNRLEALQQALDLVNGYQSEVTQSKLKV
ncbi:MAG: SulP family inorganic anion transporter, partial [Symploca sp. SIO1A3]|nr:SulP family inorganic anion transporter [Symploca sp. SIO1A3]